MSGDRGRQFFGKPILLQDWDEEAEEGAVSYWELFLDLLLVAAATSISDQFKDNLDTNGLFEFILLYMVTINGWLLYTHHITTRFEDTSMAHALILFIYYLGFGISVVNSSLEFAIEFCLGAILQRTSLLIITGNIYYHIPRARHFCHLMFGIISVSTVALLVSMWTKSVIGLVTSAVVEFLGEIIMVTLTKDMRQQMVPVNIEHSKDRLGVLVLVMMGETALSLTIGFHEAREEAVLLCMGTFHCVDTNLFYWVLGLSMLLIYMFTLLYFHMQPAPNEHALRRSVMHGTAIFLVHKFLGLALLTVGVSVKLVVQATLLEEELSPMGASLQGYAVSAALLMQLLIRWLHYGGKDSIKFGHGVYTKGNSEHLDKVTLSWWSVMGCAWMIPLLMEIMGFSRTVSPLVSTAIYAAFLFLLCMTETYFSHTIETALKTSTRNQGPEESQSLQPSRQSSYQATN